MGDQYQLVAGPHQRYNNTVESFTGIGHRLGYPRFHYVKRPQLLKLTSVNVKPSTTMSESHLHITYMPMCTRQLGGKICPRDRQSGSEKGLTAPNPLEWSVRRERGNPRCKKAVILTILNEYLHCT